MRKLFLAATAAVLLGAFAPVAAYAGSGDELVGTLAGATLGGLVGSQFGHGSGRTAMTMLGIVAGGWIGNDIGRSSGNASPYAPGGSAYIPQPPSDYPVTYTPNYVAPDAPSPAAIYVDDDYGGYCREFSQTIKIDGQLRESYGLACLQPDGSWRVQP